MKSYSMEPSSLASCAAVHTSGSSSPRPIAPPRSSSNVAASWHWVVGRPNTHEAEEAESYMWIPVWIMRTLQFSQCCQDADRHAAFLGLAPRQEPNSKSGLT